MRKSRIWAGVTAALLATALVGCASPMEGETKTSQNGSVYGELYERTVTLQDGRELTCLFWDSDTREGGLSCDWGNAR